MQLTRDVKLLNLIISSFIPPEYKNRIESKAIYNEEENIWTYQSTHTENTSIMAKRPVSAFGKNKRPQSAYAKMAATVNGNPRYRYDNILQVEVDLPMRTTSDFVQGGAGIIAPNLTLSKSTKNDQFDSLLGCNQEDVIEIEATPDVFQ